MTKRIKIMILLSSLLVCCIIFSCCSVNNRNKNQKETALTKEGAVEEESLSIIIDETETGTEVEESSEDVLDEAIKQLEELNSILQE